MSSAAPLRRSNRRLAAEHLGSMNPRTPTKADDEINRITTHLAARWSLQFPRRDATYSPSKVKYPNSTEEQVMNRLKFLVFKDPQGLTDALERFEQHAQTVYSQWQYKPRADQDVLPRRPQAESSLRPATFLRRSEVTEAAAGELMKSLLHYLILAAEHVKQILQTRSPKVYNDAISIAKGEEPRATVSENAKFVSPQTRYPRLDRYSTTDPLLQPAHNIRLSHVADQHLFSDEFGSDAEAFGIMTDVREAEIPNLEAQNPLEAKEPSTEDEEIFTTPPTTPPRPEEVHPDGYFLRQPDPVQTSFQYPPSKKRSFEESMKHPPARKVSRTRYESEHSVHEERGTIPVELRGCNSFDSATSFGTLARTTSSFSWTPNTSNRTNSIATSFSSSVDTANILMSDRPPKITRPGMINMEVERFLDANGVGQYESMDIDDSDNMDLENIHSVDHPLAQEASSNTVKHRKLSDREDDEYLAEQVLPLALLTPLKSQNRPAVSFRQLYEVTRVSMATRIPLGLFSTCLIEPHEVYDELWRSLHLIVKEHKGSLPERSSLTAWQRALCNFDGVALTGELRYAEQPGGPIFQFSLNAMKVQKSYRLARKFGGDRFCVIGMPGLSSENLPTHLKKNHSAIRKSIIKRLVDTDFCFLGRTWRAFYIKPDGGNNRNKKQRTFSGIKFRIYFFARDGHDFRNPPLTGEIDPRGNVHAPMSIEKLIDWFMPARNNSGQTCLKFFARLALGVSNTTPTVVFHPEEIVRTRDARSDNPEVRRVNHGREDVNVPKALNSKAAVMNDGCARISKTAALAIADMLRLDQTPSVFQGRIAGAKGIWMVDILDESLPHCTRDYWIEITDSQLKFEGHQLDEIYPDPDRMTFEVHSYSKQLSAATLNFQLMPILANRGVPEEVFSRLLKEDLTEKVEVLKFAMDGGLALGKWNQDNNSVTGERASHKEIQMLGGVPFSTPEKINWFLEHGFDPKTCRELKDVLFKAVREYCLRLEDKLNIGIGKSTSAFMIADPLGILEPNEIQLCFSSTFRDPKSRWEDVMLHDHDALVARLPAVLPSDIQKVRAVFRPELRRYRDVVIFSSKGSRSLADKLSGGDYDGDRAWICWEPSIVDPFQNTSIPEPQPLKFYGIEKDIMKVADLLKQADFVDEFLYHAFSFNLQPNILGLCTLYHESLCYSRTTIDDPNAVYIGALLGQLVDRQKAGIIFDEDKWRAFLKQRGLPWRLEKPAYKNKKKTRPTDHVIDRLVFTDAKGVREKALGDFNRHFPDVQSWDEDLAQIYFSEKDLAEKDQVLAKVLDDLKEKLDKIINFWFNHINFKYDDDDDDFQITRKSTAMAIPFPALVEQCRADFLAISPCYASDVDDFHIVRRWNGESDGGNFGAKHWSWLKASAFFQQKKNHTRRIVWYVAGIELGEMKAMVKGTGTYRLVKREVHHAMKLNTKLVDQFQRQSVLEAEEAEEVVEEEEEDEYGGWTWDE